MKINLNEFCQIKGGAVAHGKSFGIVVSEFNEFFTRQLLEGALDTLVRHGARKKDIQIVYVPGAFEIPLAAKKMVLLKKFDALITLAVVIRGQTKHFDQVVLQTAKGIRELSQKSEVPIILGMIPAENANQVISRVGVKHLNKGREWAMAAITMCNLMKKLTPRRGKKR